jgi:hypothetical protein
MEKELIRIKELSKQIAYFAGKKYLTSDEKRIIVRDAEIIQRLADDYSRHTARPTLERAEGVPSTRGKETPKAR